MTTEIRRRESDATARRILFNITDADMHTPMLGAVVEQVMISPNGAHWRPSTGVVVEVGNGWYHFTPTRDEIDFVGELLCDVAGHYTPRSQILLRATILPSTEVDDPAVYFTTAPPKRSYLETLAEDWGFPRNPGESDQAFRDRIRAQLANHAGSSVASLRSAIESVPGVIRVRDIENSPGTVTVRVETQIVHSGLRDLIEAEIEHVRPAGVQIDIELEHEGNAWA